MSFYQREIQQKAEEAFALLGEIVATLRREERRAKYFTVYDSQKEDEMKSKTRMTRKTRYRGVRKRGNTFEGRFMFHGQSFAVTGDTDKECHERLEELRERVKRGLPVKQYTVAEWFAEWFEIKKTQGISPLHIQDIERAYRLHLSDFFKRQKMRSVAPLDIQRELSACEGMRTRKRMQVLLTDLFSRAFENQLIEHNPMTVVRHVPYQAVKGQALTREEQEKLVAAVSGELGRFYLLCLYTGVRRSEGLKLCGEDFDFEKGLIHIRGTKTQGSDRYIPLFPWIVPVLGEQREGRLFTFSQDYVTSHFKEYCPNHKLHDLRHTFATRCLEAGIPMKTVQLWLGHSNYSTTADIYSHVTSEFMQSEVKKLNDIFAVPKIAPKFFTTIGEENDEK